MMVQYSYVLSTSLVMSLAYSRQESNTTANKTPCADPLAAILAALDCIAKEDAICASQGYNSALFRKLHNGIDTNTVIDEGAMFWIGAFLFSDLGFDFDHQVNVGPNQASIRYIEEVNLSTGIELGFEPCKEYPWGASYLQHEHAIVTVDDDCRVILWDQYGDNKEQADVDTAIAMMLADSAVQCRLGLLPIDSEACLNATQIGCRSPLPPDVTTNSLKSDPEDTDSRLSVPDNHSKAPYHFSWLSFTLWLAGVLPLLFTIP